MGLQRITANEFMGGISGVPLGFAMRCGACGAQGIAELMLLSQSIQQQVHHEAPMLTGLSSDSVFESKVISYYKKTVEFSSMQEVETDWRLVHDDLSGVRMVLCPDCWKKIPEDN